MLQAIQLYDSCHTVASMTKYYIVYRLHINS